MDSLRFPACWSRMVPRLNSLDSRAGHRSPTVRAPPVADRPGGEKPARPAVRRDPMLVERARVECRRYSARADRVTTRPAVAVERFVQRPTAQLQARRRRLRPARKTAAKRVVERPPRARQRSNSAQKRKTNAQTQMSLVRGTAPRAQGSRSKRGVRPYLGNNNVLKKLANYGNCAKRPCFVHCVRLTL